MKRKVTEESVIDNGNVDMYSLDKKIQTFLKNNVEYSSKLMKKYKFQEESIMDKTLE